MIDLHISSVMIEEILNVCVWKAFICLYLNGLKSKKVRVEWMIMPMTSGDWSFFFCKINLFSDMAQRSFRKQK